MAKPSRHSAQVSKLRGARRTHALRLLRTLMSICRQLRGLQEDPAARLATREIERRLKHLTADYQP